jgi:hypothetical protein
MLDARTCSRAVARCVRPVAAALTAQAVNKTRANGHNVLERAAQLNAHRVLHDAHLRAADDDVRIDATRASRRKLLMRVGAWAHVRCTAQRRVARSRSAARRARAQRAHLQCRVVVGELEELLHERQRHARVSAHVARVHSARGGAG